MDFTHEQLRAMIDGKTTGTSFPYHTGSEEEIEKHIKTLLHHLKQSERIDCDGEFDHYGSGYASYVELFCYKRNGGSVIRHSYIAKDSVTALEIEGVVVYASRLAPVAVIGKDQRLKSIRDGRGEKEEFYSGRSFLSPKDVGTQPSGFREEVLEIRNQLTAAGYTVLEKDDVIQPLPFEAKIPTILCIPKNGGVYKVFDAIFYWSD